MYIRIVEFDSNPLVPSLLWKGSSLEELIAKYPVGSLAHRDCGFDASSDGENWFTISDPRPFVGEEGSIFFMFMSPGEDAIRAWYDDLTYGEPAEVLDDDGYRLELYDPLMMRRCLGYRCNRNAITNDGFCGFHDRVFALVGDDEVPSVPCGTRIMIIV